MNRQSVRTRAAIAVGKALPQARDAAGEWHLGVLIDAVLAITEADKVLAIEEERRVWSGRIFNARLAGRAQALREAADELRRIAADEGITLRPTTEARGETMTEAPITQENLHVQVVTREGRDVDFARGKSWDVSPRGDLFVYADNDSVHADNNLIGTFAAGAWEHVALVKPEKGEEA